MSKPILFCSKKTFNNLYHSNASIVDVRAAYIRKLAFLGDKDHIVTANYKTVYCSYLQGPLDLNP